MRSFSWNCFEVTGSVDAYLLFKDLEETIESWHENEHQQGEEEPNLES